MFTSEKHSTFTLMPTACKRWIGDALVGHECGAPRWCLTYEVSDKYRIGVVVCEACDDAPQN